ncbi:MAG: 16S rRNA pseudouridine(516) synthase [Ruminococcaceae bacterium]|nr:16S rRNA pseudouridine(516) synthase [Oscillospiraceae bacterium]
MESYYERIDKIIASTGKLSRNEVKKAAKKGLIKVNGKTTKDCSLKITGTDTLTLNGEVITYSKYIYVMLNKPKGYVCSTDDPSSPTVNILLSEDLQRLNLFSIGRLDKNTTGLVILTNDGETAHRLISPTKHVDKKYIAVTANEIAPNVIDVFKDGAVLEDGYKCMPAELEILSPDRCAITIREGKYHQIKRMFESVGNKVIELTRVSIGNLSLDTGLKQGEYKVLTKPEISALTSQ